MKGDSALHGSLPRRYARALIQIAREENQVDTFGLALDQTARVLQTSSGGPSFLRTLADDTADVNERLSVVQEFADKSGVPALFKNFLCLLVRKERISILPQIAREYQRFQDEILGIVRVTVVTPQPPESGLLQRTERVLGQRLKKKIVSKGEADATLIGGVLLRVDHTVYDGSVRRELERIKESMLNA